MGFFKRLLHKVYLPKGRKNKLEEFVNLLKMAKKVAKPDECREAYHVVAEYVKGLDKDDPIRYYCGDIIDYLIDTIAHAERGYHKPKHNGWRTVTVYPNINDYVKLNVKI